MRRIVANTLCLQGVVFVVSAVLAGGRRSRRFLLPVAFHVGSRPRLISMLDEGGVALAAAKGLLARERSQAGEIAALRQQVRREQGELND